MIERLIEHVIQMPEDERDELVIQDVALCKIWLESKDGKASELEGADKLPGIIDEWVNREESEELNTEGRRNQTLLRSLMDEVQQARLGSLQRDEIDLLVTVFDLVERAADKEQFVRLKELLNPHMPAVKKRQGILEPTDGLDAISKKFKVVNSSDILKSRARDIKILAHIDIECRGPLLSHKGHVRVLGDVPENTTVVVEDGDCVVDGFVMGRIATSGMCEVRKNVSGVIICRDGDVRACNLIDNSFIVSKLGRVICRRAQNPRLVYAGDRIDVQGEALQGRYLAPCIEIKQETTGGEFHVTKSLRAEYFHESGDRPVHIVLRRRFTCRDYQQRPTREMTRRISEAMRLRQRVHYTRQVRDMASQESEQLAANALMFMLGGGEVKKLLDDTTRSQRRVNILNRIILGFHSLYSSTQNNLDSQGGDDEDEEEAENTDAALDELKKSTESNQDSESEEEIDSDLASESEHIFEMKKEIGRNRKDRLALSSIVTSLQRRVARWILETRELVKRIESNQKKIQALVNWGDLITGENRSSKLIMLRRVLAATKKKGGLGPLGERMNTPYIRMTLRSIRNRIDAAENARKSVQPLKVEFDQVSQALWKEHQVRIESEEEDPMGGATATGRFDTNVKIYADPTALETDDGESDTVNYFIPKPSGENAVTYANHSGSIVETASTEST